jgi:lipopolysaccharide export system permease protein
MAQWQKTIWGDNTRSGFQLASNLSIEKWLGLNEEGVGQRGRWLRNNRWLLDRYLSRESIGPLLVSWVGGTVLLSLGHLFDLADRWVLEKTSLGTIAQLFLCELPALAIAALPLAVLVGNLLAFGRLSETGEIGALQAAGASYRRIFCPILAIAAVVSLLAYAAGDWIVPAAQRHLQMLTVTSSASLTPLSAQPSLRETAFDEIRRDVFFAASPNLWLWAGEVNARQQQLRNLALLQSQPQVGVLPHALSHVTLTETATWHGKTLTLGQGIVHSYDSHGTHTAETRFPGQILMLPNNLDTLLLFNNPNTLNRRQLEAQLALLARSNLPSVALKLEWHQRLARPLASLLCALLAMPLALRTIPAQRATGLAIALFSLGLYYAVLALARSLGEAGAIAPWLSAWLPNLFFGAVGIGLACPLLRQ